MKIEYKSKWNNEEWDCEIRSIVEHTDYIEFSACGRGSEIRTYIGKNDNVYWACFPYKSAGTTLSRPEDTRWNSEELSYLFESFPDGNTVAQAIQIIGESFKEHF